MVRLAITAFQQFRDIIVPFADDQRFCIVVELFFRRKNILFNVLQRSGWNTELRKDFFVPFEDLDGIPPLPFGRHVVQNSLFDVGDGMLHRSRKCVHRQRTQPFGRFDGLLRGRHDAVVVQRGNFHDLAAEFARKFFKINLIAIFTDDVHHVHSDDHRDAELRQLRRQIEVALQIRAVDDIQNRFWLFIQQIFSCDDFFQCVGRQRIDARQIRHDDIVALLEFSFLLLHRHARPVADELVGSRQRIEKRRFAAVRIARQRNTYRLIAF